MGRVKSHLETLAEQINYVEKTIELISGHDHSKRLGVSFDETHLPLLENVLANLRMVRAWVTLPDFHQAALQILDASYEVMAELQKGGDANMSELDHLNQIELLIRRYESSDCSGQEVPAVLMRIAAFAMVAVARFVVPQQQGKEACNGED